MKKIMNLKFKNSIQKKLNVFFGDEEFHKYSLGDLLKITLLNFVIIFSILIVSFM